MNPYVKATAPLDEYWLLLVFENGERRVFDARPYVDRGIFVRLRDRAVFDAAQVVAGSVEWPGGLDLSYDTLYLESVALDATPAAIRILAEQRAGYGEQPTTPDRSE